jgi:ATP-dependent RNA helicase DDX51/DBP6
LRTRVVERIRALIILPTRDLALQVKEAFDGLCEGTDLKIGLLIGQRSFSMEQQELTGQQGDEK